MKNLSLLSIAVFLALQTLSCGGTDDAATPASDVVVVEDGTATIDNGSTTGTSDIDDDDVKEDVFAVEACVQKESDAGTQCVEELVIDFGNVTPGAGASGVVELSNLGTLTATLQGVDIDSEDFSVTLADSENQALEMPHVMQSGAKAYVTISLSPNAAVGALSADKAIIRTTGEDENENKTQFEIQLKGQVTDCDEGTGDCDADLTNGCETDLNTTTEHCGECDNACEVNKGTVACEEGACVATCDDGWAGETCDTNVDECAAETSPCDANATCTDNDGSYDCACNSGYAGDGVDCAASACPENAEGDPACACKAGYEGTLTWDDAADAWTGACTNLDECTLETDNCNDNAACTDNAGSFDCACNSGYAGDGVDCAAAACPENAEGDPACACKAGYEGTLTWDDAADAWTGSCAAAACPENAEGDPACACKAGYEGTPTWDDAADAWTGACTNLDECTLETDNCNDNATCTDNAGSYDCACNSGYAGDGVDCAASACPENAEGDPACACKAGYEGTPTWDDAADAWTGACNDVNECDDASTCDINASCANNAGGYVCSCNGGYAGDGNKCEDINECDDASACDTNATCANSIGSYACECNKGYTGDGAKCEDINECDDASTCDTNATCANSIGSFECKCNLGYTGDGTKCEDINECDDAAACDKNATCANTPGSFECKCNPGYSGDGATCKVSDYCLAELDDCDKNATCTPEAAGFSCKCNKGFEGDGKSCKDLDECSPTPGTGPSEEDCNACVCKQDSYCCTKWDGACQGCKDGIGSPYCKAGSCNAECSGGTGEIPPVADCDKLAKCTNTPGSYTCECPKGYSGDGTTCTEIDECKEGTAGCDKNAVCENTPGSFKCTCKAGYKGDGTTCTLDDECLAGVADCDTNAACTNTPDSYTCKCNKGYTGDGKACKDINECATNNGDCGDVKYYTCTNTEGSFKCATIDFCADGNNGGCGDVTYWKCTNNPGNPPTCSDLNECDTNNGGCGDKTQTKCTNNEGKAPTCTDIDECKVGTHKCAKTATCTNKDKGYDCKCNAGYTGDGKSCTDIDECKNNAAGCDANATCANLPGSVSCTCNPGYDGDGTQCKNIDDCSPNPCKNNGVCTDGLQAYTCACQPGWMGKTCETGLVIDTLNDESDGSITDGDVSLRDAISNAEKGAVIAFSPSIKGGTIKLTDRVTIAKDVTIDGQGNNITISGDSKSMLFQVNSGNVTVKNLTLANGLALGYGAMLPEGSMNRYGGGGGGAGLGAALYVHSGTVLMENVNFDSNTSQGGPGMTPTRVDPACTSPPCGGGWCGSGDEASAGGQSSLKSLECKKCDGYCTKGSTKQSYYWKGYSCGSCQGGSPGAWYQNAGNGGFGGGGGGGGQHPDKKTPGGGGGFGAGGGGGGGYSNVGGAGGLGGGKGGNGNSSLCGGGGGGGAGLGGAIFVKAGSLELKSCSFKSNKALGGSAGSGCPKGGATAGTAGYGHGGAIYVYDNASLTLSKNTFSGSAGSIAHDIFVSASAKVNGQSVVINTQKPKALQTTTAEDTALTFATNDLTGVYAAPGSNASFYAVIVASLPSSGTLTLSGVALKPNQIIPEAELGKITYTPAANYPNGTAAKSVSFKLLGLFKYTPNNAPSYLGYYGEAADISISVTPVGDKPTLGTVSVSVNEDAKLSFTTKNFTDRFYDVDGHSMTKIVVKSLPTQGALTWNGQSVSKNAEIAASALDKLLYTPKANYYGSDSFTWNATEDKEGFAGSDAKVNITVKGTNDPTTAVDDAASTKGKSPVDINVLANDKDPLDPPINGSTHKVSIVDQPTHGTVTVKNGVVTYTPDNIGGVVTFTYQVDDGTKSNVATITVTVTYDPDADTIFVDSLNDENDGSIGDGDVTLREAIANVSIEKPLIRFSKDLAGQTLKLSDRITLTKDLTIDGESNNITISGDSKSMLFQVNSGNVTVKNLTLANGLALGYGAMLPEGSMNRYGGGGGGAGLGAALYVHSGTVLMENVNFDSNTSQGGPGMTPTRVDPACTSPPCGGGWCGSGDEASAGGQSSLKSLECKKCDGYCTKGSTKQSYYWKGYSCGSCQGGSPGAWYQNAGNGGFGGGGGGGGQHPDKKTPGGGGGFGAGGGGGGGYSNVGGAGGLGGGKGGNGNSSLCGGGGGGGAGLGGAIFVKAGSLELKSCSFKSNKALGGSAGSGCPKGGATAGTAGEGHGGAIFVYDNATVKASGTTFNGNSAATSQNDVYKMPNAKVTGL